LTSELLFNDGQSWTIHNFSGTNAFLASEPVAVVHPKMKLYSVVPANLLSLYFFSGTQKVKF